MPTGHVFIATSLDGFIARPDGDIDWLMRHDDSGEDSGYYRFIADIDAIVMGRASFEKVLTFDAWHYDRPVVVLSQTLTDADIPERLAGKAEIVPDTPEQLMMRAEDRGWKRLYIDGGKLIQSLLRAGFIQDLVISRIPVLIGEGIPLFGPLPADILLEHVDTTAFPSGIVQSTYRVV
jgi:dihydrofolate reductase